VPATAPPAPDAAQAVRLRSENTRPRLNRCSAHRVRPQRPHRPRSRPVFGPPLRQLASDPSVPVEGGSANDYDYSNGDPINQFDLNGLGPCPPFLHRTRSDGSHYCKGNAAASAAHAGVDYVQDHAVDIATGAAAASVTGGCLTATVGVGSVACIAAGTGIVYMGSVSAHALVDEDKSAGHLLTAPLRPIGTGIVCGATTGGGCLGAAIRRGPKPGFPRWPW
jgi:hypothetical protein